MSRLSVRARRKSRWARARMYRGWRPLHGRTDHCYEAHLRHRETAGVHGCRKSIGYIICTDAKSIPQLLGWGGSGVGGREKSEEGGAAILGHLRTANNVPTARMCALLKFLMGVAILMFVRRGFVVSRGRLDEREGRGEQDSMRERDPCLRSTTIAGKRSSRRRIKIRGAMRNSTSMTR